MTTINHWGKWINSEIAVTGVHSIHDIDWDAYNINEEICLDCSPITDEDGEDCWDDIECDSSHTKLYGDWVQARVDNDNQAWFLHLGTYYWPDPTGEFAAIMREDVVQVVFSKTIKRCGVASICYPGQCDVDASGEFLCYVLPADMLYKE